MKIFRIIYKSIAFFLLLISFLIAAYIVEFMVRDKKKRLDYSSRLTSFFSRLCLKILRIRIKIKDPHRIRDKRKGYLIISNHLSYLDIFIISSVIQSIFVAGVDSVEEKFLLGTVTRLSGGVFVLRENRSRISKDLENISSVLQMGFNVVLFPEGTTSNGDSVLPFKSSFFSAATLSKSDILPICLKYSHINGCRINQCNKDLIFYYEQEVDFFDHFFRMITTSSVDVEVNFLEVIEVMNDMSRKKIAEGTYKTILSKYKS